MKKLADSIPGGEEKMIEKHFKIPNNIHDSEFTELALQMCKVKFDATRRYGPAAGTLGTKGLFCDLNRKFQRIKRYLWEEHREATKEEIEDTLFDNAVYSLLMIMELKSENKPEYP